MFLLVQKKSTRMGFEPTRAEPIGLAVQRLNHSAASSDESMPIPSFLPLGYENLVRGYFAGENLVKDFSLRDFLSVGFFRGRLFGDVKFSWLGFLAPIFFVV